MVRWRHARGKELRLGRRLARGWLARGRLRRGRRAWRLFGGRIEPLVVAERRRRVLVAQRTVAGQHRRDEGRGDSSVFEMQNRVGRKCER